MIRAQSAWTRCVGCVRGRVANAAIVGVQLVCLIAWASTAGGCSIPSLQPVYAADKSDVVEEKGLVGNWRKDGDESEYELLAGADKLYVLNVNKGSGEDEGETVSSFDVYLVRIGDSLVADLTPRESERKRLAQRFGTAVLSAHVLLKLELKGDDLTAWQLGDKAQAAIKADSATCPSAMSGEMPVLTGTSAQVRALVQKHGGEEGFWEASMKLKRQSGK